MKTYKIDKTYIILLFLLIILSGIFLVSHIIIGGNSIKFLVIGFLILFILFNLVNLSGKKVQIDNEKVIIKSLTGTRELKFNEIEDITILKLKGRFIFIIADKEKYGFLSSMFENFDEIFTKIKNSVNDDIKNKLSGLDSKSFKTKKSIFIAFLIGANLFLMLASAYNFIN